MGFQEANYKKAIPYEELVVGKKYRVSWSDCCVAGNYVGIYRGPVFSETDKDWVTFYEFDNFMIDGDALDITEVSD